MNTTDISTATSSLLETCERLETITAETLRQIEGINVRENGYLQSEVPQLQRELQQLISRCDAIRFSATRDAAMPIIRTLSE